MKIRVSILIFLILFCGCETAPSTYMFFAKKYSAGGYYDYAIEEYTRGIKKYSNNYELYFGRGKLYYSAGQYQKAIEDFSQVISLNAMILECYKLRGIAYLHLENYNDALTDFLYCLSIDTDDRLSNYYVAMVFSRKSDFSNALYYINRLIGLNLYDVDAYIFRCGIYILLTEYESALNDINNAIIYNERNDRIPELHNSRGIIKTKMDNYKEAFDDYSLAIFLDGTNSEYYYNRGDVSFEMGDYNSAFSDINKAIELYQDDPEYYRLRINILIKMTEIVDDNFLMLKYLNMGKEDFEKVKKLEEGKPKG